MLLSVWICWTCKDCRQESWSLLLNYRPIQVAVNLYMLPCVSPCMSHLTACIPLWSPGWESCPSAVPPGATTSTHTTLRSYTPRARRQYTTPSAITCTRSRYRMIVCLALFVLVWVAWCTLRASTHNLYCSFCTCLLPSVLWHCWLDVRKSIRPVNIEWWLRCWCSYLSGLFAYGPADATTSPKPGHLSLHLNPDWFYLSGTGLPRLFTTAVLCEAVDVTVCWLYLDYFCACFGDGVNCNKLPAYPSSLKYTSFSNMYTHTHTPV